MAAANGLQASIPEGFQPLARHGSYADRIGPFHARKVGDRCYRYGFVADHRHANPQGQVHGGALYSFADHIAGHALVHATGRVCATVKSKVEFMAAPPLGGWIDGCCDIVRVTRSLAFVRLSLYSGTRLTMSADGCFRIGGPIDDAGADLSDTECTDPVESCAPDGFKAFRLQGAFAESYGPMHYRKDADHRFVCGIATHGGHDNSTGAMHGGALFAFADDCMGRAVSATSRRYASTIALDAQYLGRAPLGAWLEGRAEITATTDDLSYVRCRIDNAGEPVLDAASVFRMFRRYDV